MKDFNEIMSHVLAIDKADTSKAISLYERKKNLEALACKVADELVAGRPAPAFNDAGSISRLDGMLPVLANELVSQHDMAIAHRTHLAERLEADGGENGAKAAAILRGMNKQAEPTTGRPLEFCFGGLRATLRPTSGCGIPADGMVNATVSFDVADGSLAGMRIEPVPMPAAPTWSEDDGVGWILGLEEQKVTPTSAAPGVDPAWAREQEVALVAQHAANNAKRIEEAEQRGFDKGRNLALSIVLDERGKWSKDVVRDVLGKVSEAIVYMQKEG